jgi:hypothetical protein
VDWIETLTAMGQANPFFERAGFVRVGVIRKRGRKGGAESAYGGHAVRLRADTVGKSRFSEPVYYVFDNRTPDRGKERANNTGHSPGPGQSVTPMAEPRVALPAS